VRRDYREDIDWLRAIAVLAVVAFHFEAPAVFGGFVGVDIFFVISGYLITGIIQSEVKSGSFSFAQFYERRVRRLLPALYAMVALTAIPTFHYLLTSERQEFFRSVAAVVTFTSNFFFWFQTGYFDHAAVEKPLLHTWSLAVEEQFYLALPVLLWALLRFTRARIALPAALGALALASFALSIWLMKTDRSANAFFMSPPRAWEFLFGGLVAIEGFPVLRSALAQLVARGVALVLLAIPIFSLRQGPGFPGFNALTPCIGAAMFIWSGIGRTLAEAKRIFAAQRRKILRADFLFAVSLALAAVHLRAVFQKQPHARCRRQDRAVRADGGNLLSVVAVCRTAVPPEIAGADAPRRIPRRRPQHSAAAGRQCRRNCCQPDAVGCRPRRAAAGILQRLQFPAVVSFRQLFRAGR
jgi:peptidoglycan/LPS O-acetylase OafA/YrhL